MKLITVLRFYRQLKGKKPVNIESIQSMGLLAVKLGQIFALRPDLIEPQRCIELQRLYSRAATIPEEDSQKLLNRFAQPGRPVWSFPGHSPGGTCSSLRQTVMPRCVQTLPTPSSHPIHWRSPSTPACLIDSSLRRACRRATTAMSRFPRLTFARTTSPAI